MSEFIGRDALLAKRSPRRKVFTFPDTIPDLAGKKLLLQAPTSTERAAWEASLVNPQTGQNDPKRMKQMRERLICLCVIDEAGNRIFGKADIDALKQLDATIIVAVFNALASMLAADDEDLEDLAGNLPATASESPT